MPKPKIVKTSFSSDAMTAERLQVLADRSGMSVSNFLSHLVNRAWEDPDGYYLRTAAIQSWTAAAMATMTAFKAFGQAEFVQVLAKVDDDAKTLFGYLPEPPAEFGGRRVADPRIRAIIDAYAALVRNT